MNKQSGFTIIEALVAAAIAAIAATLIATAAGGEKKEPSSVVAGYPKVITECNK